MKEFFKKHELIILICFQLICSALSFLGASVLLLGNDCTFEGRDASLVVGGGLIGLFAFCIGWAHESFLMWKKNRKSPDNSGENK